MCSISPAASRSASGVALAEDFECSICYGSVSLSAVAALGGGTYAGACGHGFCWACLRNVLQQGLEELSRTGGARLPAGGPVTGDSAVVVDLPGLLCRMCIAEDSKQRGYAEEFASAVRSRAMPSRQLLAFTAETTTDAELWRFLTVQHGLPPGWISPLQCSRLQPWRRPLRPPVWAILSLTACCSCLTRRQCRRRC